MKKIKIYFIFTQDRNRQQMRKRLGPTENQVNKGLSTLAEDGAKKERAKKENKCQ